MTKKLKLDSVQLKNLQARQTAIQSVDILKQAAQRELQFFVRETLSSFGLDPNKQYNIDADGVILEVTSVPVIKEDSK